MSAQPVVCPACGWRGHRTYIGEDMLPAPNMRHTDAWGLCVKCGTALVRRPSRAAVKAARVRAEFDRR